MSELDSPVSNNGRGLKPISPLFTLDAVNDSPVSNNGRGLKPDLNAEGECIATGIRPLAITGVD